MGEEEDMGKEVITKHTFIMNILEAGVEGVIMTSVTQERVTSEVEADIKKSSTMTLVTHQEDSVGAMAQIQAVMVAIPREFKTSAAFNMGEEISAIHLEAVTSEIH